MITEAIKIVNNFKLQEKPCPGCGEEVTGDVCLVCNPEEATDEIEEKADVDSIEEEI